ncbi:MAG: thermonuclease family protein, partial [Alphaproteobacteria bacterium]
MSKMFLTFAAVFLALSGAANPGLADQVGSPTVMSGDVLEVAGRRFHLYGIDAPEMDQSCMVNG